ncbi:MAG TPA: hypothetical protein VFI14_02920 [Chryseosolibacter sp.]|nr:hypothetical protein [Chryseosolibacter sp.]
MADERDLQLLDDYLSNRMGGADRSNFEQRMQADPDLQGEYALQKVLVKGIREARVAELKTMLKNVPVPAAGSGNAYVGKVVVGALTIILAAAAYWYLRDDDAGVRTPIQATEQKVADEQPVVRSTPPEADRRSDETKTPSLRKPAAEPDKNQTSAGTEHSKPSLARRPDPVLPPAKKQDNESADETTDEVNSPSEPKSESEHALLPVDRSIAVETISDNSSYSFHYQVRDGKLLLFGPFHDGEYSVKEFLLDGKPTTFMFYRDQYYSIDRSNTDVKPLTPVADEDLLLELGKNRSK